LHFNGSQKLRARIRRPQRAVESGSARIRRAPATPCRILRTMRRGLALEDLGDLLDQPAAATLPTYRADGTILVSPGWFRWSSGVHQDI
jgi:hypothetical protein